MGIAHPKFPNTLWDGLSLNTARVSITDDQWPNQQDWDQIVQEVIEVEKYLLNNPITQDDDLYKGIAQTTISKGQAIYVTNMAGIDLADSGHNLVSGIALVDAIPGDNVIYARRGKIELADWTSVTGSSLLLPGRDYFVATNGSLSLTAPTTGYVIKIGQAQTTTIFDTHPQSPIKL